MPSDRWGWLRSQGLGVACGLGTVALLALGSVVMAATREGASADVALDDLTAFFTRPSPAHLWLYLLFPLAGLYALNTLLATTDNLARRWRAGQRVPSAYAAAVIHLGFLLALAAHAVGGFRSQERGAVLLGPGWRDLPGFGEARVVSLEVDELPGGMPREVRAVVELRQGGELVQDRVGYNQPLSRGAGARLALLQDFGRVPVARLRSGEARCELAEGERCLVDGQPIEVAGFGRARGAAAPAVLVRARGPDGAPAERWLAGDALLALARGRPLALEGVAEGPALLLRVRETPGNPWALSAAVVLALGTALMWRRLAPWPRRAQGLP